MATGDKYRILCTKRKELIQLIQRDPDNIVDELLALSIITEEEYNSFNQKEDIVIKIRKLLIHIQKKGESTCQQFLECLEILFPGTNQNLQPSGHVCPPAAATCPQHIQVHPNAVGHEGHCEEVEAALPGREQRVQRGEPGVHVNANHFLCTDGELQLLQVQTPQ
ncbi:unnamed protein product [Lepidochelys olivacea]